MTDTNDLPHVGVLLGSALVVAILVGFVVGMFLFGWAQWELAKNIGRTTAISYMDRSGLSLCEIRLREGELDYPPQAEACADIIARTLEAVEWKKESE